MNIPISKSYRKKCESFKSCHCQLLKSYFATYIFLKGSKILRKPPACLSGTLQQSSHATRSITQSTTHLLSTKMAQTHRESYLMVSKILLLVNMCIPIFTYKWKQRSFNVYVTYSSLRPYCSLKIVRIGISPNLC